MVGALQFLHEEPKKHAAVYIHCAFKYFTEIFLKKDTLVTLKP